MKWFSTWMLMLAIFGIVTACEKNNPEKIWVYIEETGCANGWNQIDEATVEEQVIEYLKNHNILTFDIEVEVYSEGEACFACTCLTGRRLSVLILKDDQEKIQELGFYEWTQAGYNLGYKSH